MAEELAAAFPSLEAIASASEDQLAQVKGFGPKRAGFIREYFDSPEGRKILADLQRFGIRTTAEVRPVARSHASPLAGKTVVITGTLRTMDRAAAERAVRAAGGHPSSSVSKKTDFVVVGDSPGSKRDKAVELGIPLLSEEEFLRLLQPVSTPAVETSRSNNPASPPSRSSPTPAVETSRSNTPAGASNLSVPVPPTPPSTSPGIPPEKTSAPPARNPSAKKKRSSSASPPPSEPDLFS
jgi:DNA ligase (NAD+)